MKFQILGQDVDLDKLPDREATELERRQMLGSLATLYEMKVPLVHCIGTRTFYPLDHQELTIDFTENTELVILKTEIILPSIFRKPPKKRRLKKA